MAIAAGATTVQINPNSTEIDDAVTFALRGPAGTVLPQLIEALTTERHGRRDPAAAVA